MENEKLQDQQVFMHQIILCNCPDQPTAEKIARKLVTDQLAACINILPTVTSIYRWQGEIETARESMLLIKSRRDYYPQIEQSIIQLHPYELPEIIAVPIEHGLSDYLKWIDACLITA